MSENHFRFLTVKKPDADEPDYLEKFSRRYPNGLGPVENQEYLQLCVDKTPRSAIIKKAPVDAKYFRLEDRRSAFNDLPRDRIANLSVTLTPGRFVRRVGPWRWPEWEMLLEPS